MRLLLKVLVTLVLVFFLIFKINWQEIFTVIKTLSWWIIPVAILMQLLIFYIGNIRWYQILKIHSIKIAPLKLYKYYLIGTFFNNFLPTTVGGDVYRAYFIYKNNSGLVPSLMPIIFERFIGLICLVGIGTIALLFYNDKTNLILVLSYSLIAIFSATLFGLFIIFNLTTYAFIKRIIKKFGSHKLLNKIFIFIETFHEYTINLKLIFKLVVLTLILQLIAISIFALLGYGVGSELNIIKYLQIVPVVLTISSLPISIGGLGIRELTAITLLVHAGMLETHAAAISIVFLFVLIISSSVGLFFFLHLNENNVIKNAKTLKNELDNKMEDYN